MLGAVCGYDQRSAANMFSVIVCEMETVEMIDASIAEKWVGRILEISGATAIDEQ